MLCVVAEKKNYHKIYLFFDFYFNIEKLRSNKFFAIYHARQQYCECFKNYRVIKVENLDEEINKINIERNINISTKFNSHHFILKKDDNNNNDDTDECIGHTKYSELLINKKIDNLCSYKIFYDDDIKELIYNIYQDDINNFNYEYPYLA